ncbi:molecular chaperone DnaJ [Photobacterium aquae]|uniref:Molecular chaperone DnaJ n=1 Tax=Photobacterium aquae TaxID=1195763 RepID=A0A0J1JY73_9GAMM|nr:DNA-J related domain-containing protein [Photobacterium aquae]KLV07202.1 molecular chaperone DnaJ [Photobacterium aquae]
MTQPHQTDNPLTWPLMSLLQQQPQGWKIHTLATALREKDLLGSLDDDPLQDLFKANFLIMNALFQLRELLLPQQWLSISSMQIELSSTADGPLPAIDDPLADYYLNWTHYNTDNHEIDKLLDHFWQRYQHHIDGSGNITGCYSVDARNADLASLDLEPDASSETIRRQWRRLALRWHPDRPNGDNDRFRQLCAAWQRLRQTA